MLRSNRDSNYCSRDHVNQQSKFCFDIIEKNNSILNILICLVLQNCIKDEVLRSFNL